MANFIDNEYNENLLYEVSNFITDRLNYVYNVNKDLKETDNDFFDLIEELGKLSDENEVRKLEEKIFNTHGSLVSDLEHKAYRTGFCDAFILLMNITL